MRRIVDFAPRENLPAIYTLREFAEAGGLMGCGFNFADRMHRAAAYVDKILKGAKPAEPPIEQPTKYELVIKASKCAPWGMTITSIASGHMVNAVSSS